MRRLSDPRLQRAVQTIYEDKTLTTLGSQGLIDGLLQADIDWTAMRQENQQLKSELEAAKTQLKAAQDQLNRRR